MTERSAAWAAFLDSLESELHAVRRTSADRARSRVHFVAPADLGPLPRELAGRARELLSAVHDATDAVRDEMQRTSRQLDELRTIDPRAPRSSTSFDSRA